MIASKESFPPAAARKVYVPGRLFPELRVPMREIHLSPTKSFNGQMEQNLPVRVYDSHAKRFADFETLASMAAKADVVFVGEQHDDVNSHRLELALLEQLVTQPGKLLTHEHLLRQVWGQGYGSESNYLRVYVGQLRRKLGDDAANPRLIVTEPGIGYRWVGSD